MILGDIWRYNEIYDAVMKDQDRFGRKMKTNLLLIILKREHR